jgi:ribonuclease BN (tRNA processing enzyme)
LYGPHGTIDFCNSLFEKVYPSAPEIVRRIRDDGWNVAANEVAEGLVSDSNGFRVVSVPVEHGIPAVAYRIETGEGVVVISGDTRPCRSLIELAKGADLLVQECSFPDDMSDLARVTNHSTASEVGDVANKAAVKGVVLTHLFPHWSGREKEMAESVSNKFGGKVIIGRDLLEIAV